MHPQSPPLRCLVTPELTECGPLDGDTAGAVREASTVRKPLLEAPSRPGQSGPECACVRACDCARVYMRVRVLGLGKTCQPYTESF